MTRNLKATALSVAATAALAGAIVAGSASSASAAKPTKAPVKVSVLSPRAGDVAGKESKGFFVDLALRYPSLAASGAGFQLTGPTAHLNQAPFPERSGPVSTRRSPA